MPGGKLACTWGWPARSVAGAAGLLAHDPTEPPSREPRGLLPVGRGR